MNSNIIKVFRQRSKFIILLIVLLGGVNSVLNGGLLMFINNTIMQKPLPYFPQFDWLIFILMLLGSLLCSRMFQTHMVNMTNNILFEFDLNILNRLKHASFEDFEKLGHEKVYAVINDTRVLGHAPEVFMNAFNSLIIAICCFAYLFWISPVGGAIILMVMVALLVFYMIRNKQIEKQLNQQRDLLNSYFMHLNDLLRGFREVKMSLLKNENIFTKYLIKNRLMVKDISIDTSIKYMNNELTGTYSWYIVLGVIMFLMPRIFDLTIANTTAFLVTVLYLIGPVAVLVALIPTYTAVKIAAERLNSFDKEVGIIEMKSRSNENSNILDKCDFDNIRFEDVTFWYSNGDDDRSFALEPINIQIEKGELIFVAGGNGSGKSTFAYLLAGLYKPKSGKIFFNNQEITDDLHFQYSDKMSAIFTNNHLFRENYDNLNLLSTNNVLKELLQMLHLTDVVRFDDKKNNLGRDFSKGQQKRLALIYALLEDKQIILLDEWAAEQDPGFRKYFYKEVLPILRRQGKTIIAITHDDDYYSCASRLIKFDYGKIVSDSKLTDKNIEINCPSPKI
ncbi:cyclic peptide export ABC transporter [Fulvivirgaceae bacterium BMA12]|uniref:Cyclic peptide export ABC transporter n=1 Tax=Agaribacillus aureus TaxID=3051825 RepID=A0ABT8LI76_9BACT|nr:cyclic peptide export ABC transporter [Fulvivirgaceae bacterium BMA12]